MGDFHYQKQDPCAREDGMSYDTVQITESTDSSAQHGSSLFDQQYAQGDAYSSLRDGNSGYRGYQSNDFSDLSEPTWDNSSQSYEGDVAGSSSTQHETTRNDTSTWGSSYTTSSSSDFDYRLNSSSSNFTNPTWSQSQWNQPGNAHFYPYPDINPHSIFRSSTPNYPSNPYHTPINNPQTQLHDPQQQIHDDSTITIDEEPDEIEQDLVEVDTEIGRKDKRRMQNRLAQRAFRVRAKSRRKEAGQHLEDLESLTKNQAAQIGSMGTILEDLQAENTRLKLARRASVPVHVEP